jgi:predicted O-linked N-acetylglucosamine transferase (SPINDLY family)
MTLSENSFLVALQKIATGSLALTELIDKASGLVAAGQIDPARQLYKAWINGNGQHPLLYVAYFNCSALDGQTGDAKAAVEALTQAIALNADFIPAYINLGGFLERSGGAGKAVELWQSAVSRSLPITGNNVSHVTTTLKQIARVLSEHQQVERAEAAVQHCLDIAPQQQDIIEQYVALRLSQCKWPVIVPSERLDRKTLMRGIHPLSMAVYTDDPILQLASADRYVRNSAAEGPHAGDWDRRCAPIDTETRRLRVGYISSDLRDHAVGYLMAEFFELHNKSEIEVFAYYCGPESNSPLMARIKSAIEHWSDIRTLSDDAAAGKIASDGIDILVDVNGHTRDARTGVFARRPAPILVNWLGFPGTMGTPYHHYIVADDWIIPEALEKFYSEKVLRLPCYQPNDRKREVAEAPSRSGAGLPQDAFVYCCFNGAHKISRFTFERWLDILKRVPDSVLWLLDCSAETKARLTAHADRHGVAGTRLIFAPKLKNAFHLARYPLGDLFLDTAPYGAHTTASDALWMGVPVLTLSGRSFASRVCGSLVRSAGLSDLVFTDPQDYVERAVALGGNPSAIQAYKAKLRAGRDSCTLFDTRLLVDRLEELYRGMCRDYRAGRLPQPDLANLDAYLEVGIGHDHEGQELLATADYDGLYKTKLARRHLSRPLTADHRLWTAADIASAGSSKTEIKEPISGNERDQKMTSKRRKTATR